MLGLQQLFLPTKVKNQIQTNKNDSDNSFFQNRSQERILGYSSE